MTLYDEMPNRDRKDQNFDSAELALLLFKRWRSRRLIEKLPMHLRPTSLADAYSVQSRVLSQMGDVVAGYKVELGSESAMRWTGLGSPVLAHIPRSRLFTNDSELASKSAGKLHVGAEIAFVFNENKEINGKSVPFGKWHIAIKFSRSRFFDWRAMGVLSHVADNVGLDSLVLGKAISPENLEEALSSPVGVYRDDVCLATGLTDDDRPDLPYVLASAVQQTQLHQLALRPGMLLTSGNLVSDCVADLSGNYEVRLGNWRTRAFLHA